MTFRFQDDPCGSGQLQLGDVSLSGGLGLVMRIWQLSQADCWSNRARICQNILSPILKNPGVSCLYLLRAGRTVRATVPSLYSVGD